MNEIRVLKVTTGTGEVFYVKPAPESISEVVSETLAAHPCPVTFRYMTTTEFWYGILLAKVAIEDFRRKVAEIVEAAA